MAGPSSNIPTSVGKPVHQAPSGQGESAESAPKPQGRQSQQASPDQFSKTAVNELLEQMRKSVTRQGDQQFDPARLVRQAQGTPTVKTEELRSEMRQAMQAGKGAGLSSFEKVFMEFFAGLRKIAVLLKKGKKKFKKKKKDEWKEFFERLFPYAKEKKTEMQRIRELVFRGLSDEDPRLVSQPCTAKGTVLVADIVFTSGRSDKFARLPLSPNGTIAELKALKPGDRIDEALLQKCLGTGELEYLSLYYKPVRSALPSQMGSELAQNLQRQADAAARAHEAMSNTSMGISSHAANLASERVKKGQRPPQSDDVGVADKGDAEKHSLFQKLFGK